MDWFLEYEPTAASVSTCFLDIKDTEVNNPNAIVAPIMVPTILLTIFFISNILYSLSIKKRKHFVLFKEKHALGTKRVIHSFIEKASVKSYFYRPLFDFFVILLKIPAIYLLIKRYGEVYCAIILFHRYFAFMEINDFLSDG